MLQLSANLHGLSSKHHDPTARQSYLCMHHQSSLSSTTVHTIALVAIFTSRRFQLQAHPESVSHSRAERQSNFGPDRITALSENIQVDKFLRHTKVPFGLC